MPGLCYVQMWRMTAGLRATGQAVIGAPRSLTDTVRPSSSQLNSCKTRAAELILKENFPLTQSRELKGSIPAAFPMAEVVGLVASIVAVADLAEAVVRACKSYIDAVKDAPRDLRLIVVEVSTLKGLLDSITLLKDTSLLVDEHKLLLIQVQHLREILTEIDGLLSEHGIEKPGHKRRKVARTLSTLAWPIRKPRVMQRLEDVGKCKSTISLILLADTSKEIKEISQDVREIKDKLSENERREILEKLVTVDPSSNHSQASHLHEPHTSSWITRSDEWGAWLHSDLRFLWIHGIPGAGKTILASFIVEQVRSFCEQADSAPFRGWSYYYCYHGRSEHTGETAPFLGWIISQLCKQAQYVPEEVTKAFRSDNITVSADLISALAVLARRLDKIYIVIDALDECQHRQSFLALLQNLHSSPLLQNLHILATSRDEVDIRMVMSPIASSVSMKNSLVDEDIRRHIQSQLGSDPKFTRWPPNLLQEVEFTLADGAKGMFRWAACQLEILRRLSTASAVRRALKDLPDTLDETYERILCSIPRESRHLAYRTLSWLCVGKIYDYDDPEVIAEAIRWTDLSQNRPDDEIFDIDNLFEFCVCLLTTTTRGTIALAHYTVQEFLCSKRIASGPVSEFCISSNDALRLYFTTLLNRLSWPEQPESISSANFLSLCWFVIIHCYDSADEIISQTPSLYLKFCKILHPSSNQVSKIMKWTTLEDLSVRRDISMFLNRFQSVQGDNAELIARLCELGAPKIASAYVMHLEGPQLQSLFESTVPFDQSISCAILEFVAAKDSGQLVQLFVQHGCRPGPDNKVLFCLMAAFSIGQDEKSDLETALAMVLDAGANPNPINVSHTPLQMAVAQLERKAVSLLLKFGANANAIGDCAAQEHLSVLAPFPSSRSAMKPLAICLGDQEQLQDLGVTDNSDRVIQALKDIENLLRQHGATA